jgi:hypothetical protein
MSFMQPQAGFGTPSGGAQGNPYGNMQRMSPGYVNPAASSVSPGMPQVPGANAPVGGGQGGGGNYSISPSAGGNPLNPTFSNYNVSPGNSLAQWQSGIAPQQWQANQNAMQAGAASGLSGGPLNQVVTDANSQFMAAQAPQLAQFLQNAQGMGLDQSMFNAGAANTAGQNQAYYNNQQGQNNQNSIFSLLQGLGGIAPMFGM